jgi:hypothetical protein
LCSLERKYLKNVQFHKNERVCTKKNVLIGGMKGIPYEGHSIVD